MATPKPKPTIDDLIQTGDWAGARARIEQELQDDPENHWLQTQLGVTYYEQREYGKALRIFARSAEIVPDCPLTLWNLAGTLAALGEPGKALLIYKWLIGSDRTAEDDSCWESDEWADSLRTDCVFRAAGCFEQLGKPRVAEDLYSQYLRLLSDRHKGTYPAEDAERRIRAIRDARGEAKRSPVWDSVRDKLDSLNVARSTPRPRLPRIDADAILSN